MKERVLEFAKRIGSDIGTLSYDDITTELLSDELYRFSSQATGLLTEEVEELCDATIDEDIVEMLDAVIDIQYYLYQMINWLELAGIDFKGAFEAVCDNNDSKYTTSIQLAQKWYTEAKAVGRDVVISDTQVDGVNYFCLKNSDSKVVKPEGFEKVDLFKFIPEKLL